MPLSDSSGGSGSCMPAKRTGSAIDTMLTSRPSRMAATGLTLFMAGDVVFIAMFAFLAWGRLALQPFA